jgi:hypothetical protein
MKSTLSSMWLVLLPCIWSSSTGCPRTIAREGRPPSSFQLVVPAYERALASGFRIPLIREFNDVFDSARNSIAGYGTSRPKWSAQALLFGRYVVVLQMPLRLNGSRTTVTGSGDARFWVREIQEVSEDGAILYTPHQMDFGVKDWRKIIQSGGDFSVIGYSMIKKQPVRGLENCWWSA